MRLRKWALINSTNIAGARSLNMLMHGKMLLQGLEDGRIWKILTRLWTTTTLNRYGGHSSRCMKKDMSTKVRRYSCTAQDAQPLLQKQKLQWIIHIEKQKRIRLL